MAKLWLGPVGQVSKGHVLDVAEKPFVRALKDYDKQLYVKWNPKKLKGHGCWEIRRRPDMKSVKEVIAFKGNTYTVVEYRENNLIHHVLDCAFLNYDQLRKIQEMDVFANPTGRHVVDEIEHQEREYAEAQRQKAAEATKYAIKHYRKEMKDFKEMVQSGLNPASIARYWETTKKQD